MRYTFAEGGSKWPLFFTSSRPCTLRITCKALCNNYIGESGRKLGDSFRELYLMSKTKDQYLVARHFNLPGTAAGFEEFT